MAKVVGIVNLHSDVQLNGLTARRPLASVNLNSTSANSTSSFIFFMFNSPKLCVLYT